MKKIYPHILLILLLIFQMAANAVQAGFDTAAQAFAKGDYVTVKNVVEPLAEQGDARSQYAMGVLYENGFAVDRDPAKAAAWYLKAARQGNIDAQYNLGAMNEHGTGIPVDYTTAAYWYHIAAEQGDIDALSNLGVLYQNGQGVQKDRVLALALYNVSVALANAHETKASGNRQLLANQMNLLEVKSALQLTRELLKPGNLKPALDAYLKRTIP